MKNTLLLLSLIIILAGCASKRFVKKAMKFESAGLYEDAAEYYYQAVKRKAGNLDAKIGLRKTGQLTLDKKLSEFSLAYKQSENKKAVYSYLDSEKYYKKVNSVGVQLSFADHYKEYYNEVKNSYLEKQYNEGVDKLNLEEFNAATLIFQEIKNIDTNYKDVVQMLTTTKNEPKYRKANEYLDLGLYRKAYYTYSEIINDAGTYKQSEILKEEALKKGIISIVIIPFKSSAKNLEYSRNITEKLNNSLSNFGNPFIKIIDISVLDRSVLDRKYMKINMPAANLSGIKAVLYGEVIRVHKISGELKKTEKKAYLKEVKIKKNKAGEEYEDIQYEKISYYEYQQKNSVSIEINYKLISTENNSVMVSDIISLSDKDEIHYAIFDGDKNKLVPGYWKYAKKKSTEDIIKDNSKDRKKLKNLLKADKKIHSTNYLINNLYKEIISEITYKIDQYNPEN